MSYRLETKFKKTAIGLVPEDWKVLKILDICNISSSKRIFLREYVKSGIPFYRSKEIILRARDKEIKDPLFITQNKYNEIKVKFGVPQEGEILLTSVGTLGVAYLIKNNDKFYFKDGNLTWFKDFKGLINSEFLYYWLKSNVAQKQIDTIAIGSTQKALTIDSLKDMNISLMSINEQNKISKFFSDLDKKIGLNKKINLILEQISQTIFKHWFIDFEFPNEKGQSYKSSGGEFIDSKLGKIPKEWKAGKFKDLIEVKTDRVRKNNEYLKVFSVINSGNIVLSDDFFNKRVYSKDIYNYKIVNTKEFAFNPARINIGSIGMNEFTFSGAISPVYVVFKTKDDYEYFLQIILKLPRIKNIIKQLCSGTVRQTITYKDFSSIGIIIPPVEIIEKFNDIYLGLKKLVDFNNLQNQILMKIRDTLLPKLITGKIRINLEDIKES